MRFKDFVNKNINGFSVLDYEVEKRKGYLLVKCPICNNVKWMRADGVTKAKSCGCLSKEIHAESAKKRMLESVKAVCVEDTRLDNLVAKKPKNNTSGVKGVTWDKSREKWTAQIRFKGKHYYLGRYATIEEASKARAKAEEELFKPVLDKYNYKAN